MYVHKMSQQVGNAQPTEDAEDIAFIKTVRIDQPVQTYRVGSDCSRRSRKSKYYKTRRTSIPQCDEGDFVIQDDTCPDGSRFLICAKAPENVCPNIGDNEGEIMSIDAVQNSRETVAMASCGYTKDVFTSETVVTDYQDIFGADEDFLLVLSETCFQTTENCPVDPLTQKKMPLCSRYVSPDKTGETCRQEALVPGNETAFQTRMEEYCRTETTPDCRCIDRSTTQIYDALRTGSINDDGCWWKWCADSKSFLVPPNITKATSPANCTTTLKAVADKINKNVDKLECCQIQQNVIYAPNGTVEQPVNCFFNDAVLSQQSWFEQYGWWILIIVVIIIVIVGILAIWLSHSYYRRRDSVCQ